ncbi:protein MAIN-LIKE 2-like [Camellia sinensis]|uniref:protein MAIN-LIKE 2-like n=1 Tax=Camellia sinensis TaxID=4442 RepID=UPI001036A683|nr:protein MAIN-LIKE 2-like [Camellia sinensis]
MNVNNDYVDDDIGVEDDDVDNDIGVEADLMEDDVSVDDDNTELVPSAPKDPSLLISFRNHVAAVVWKKKERGPLKCLNRSQKLAKWPWMSSTLENGRWRHLVEQSGLSVLIDHTYRYGNRVAIFAFVERWHPKTNTFHMPDGEMTITLDDVRTILGIPVTGRALSCPKSTRYEAAELVSATLGVQAYLLYLLGCTLFADKSGIRVPVAYLHMLTNIDAVSSYAWGAAALAFLYKQLRLASRAGVKQIVGYLKLLEAWIYEHFRLGRPHPNLSYSDEQPRVCRWSPWRDGVLQKTTCRHYESNLTCYVLMSVGAAIHSLGHDQCVLHPDMLYETIGRMLQVLDGPSLGSISTHTEHQVYYYKRHRMDST